MKHNIEHYASGFIEEKPKSAIDILKLVERRTGRKPRILKDPAEIYKEEYKMEGLL